MKSLKVGSVMMVIGFFLILTFLFEPKTFFINLVHGTSFSTGQINIDYQIGNSAVLEISLFSIIVGFLLRIKR
jgi:hypothetical protein